MKKMIERFHKLSFAVKIQLIIAFLCSAAIPVFAWFAFQDTIGAMTRIKEPPSINLASGGNDPAVYINLENIDVTSASEKYVVFSVEPGKYTAYDIQLSHTTNIPFTYELYRVQEDENGLIEYTDHTRNSEETTLHYSIMTSAQGTTAGKLTLTDINPDTTTTSRTIGNEAALSNIRQNYVVGDDVNQYVKPLYSVTRRIPQLNRNEDGSADRDYFTIKLLWTPGNNLTDADSEYWNYAFNNKETDIIYISAKQNSLEETP